MQIAADEERLDWMGQDCWFCSGRPPALGKSYRVKVKKYTDGPGGAPSVLRAEVAVPRCEECWRAQQRASSQSANLLLGGGALAFLVFVVWSPLELPAWGKGLLVLAGCLPGALRFGGAAGLPPGQRPESSARGFMAVQALEQQGWLPDDAP